MAFCQRALLSYDALAKSFRWVIALTVLATLSACGPGKTITTVDNSADYKTASSRPPLKKPSAVNTAPASDVLSSSSAANTPEIATPSPAPSSTEQATPSVTTEDAYIPERDDSVAEVDSAIDSTLQDSPSSVIEESEAAETQIETAATSGSFSARVISPKEGVSRLQVEAEFEEAWSYLSRSLQQSDVTVFSRNKAAGRFAIGCSGIDSAPTVVRKGGWSFLNRKSKLQQEYCALQAVATRGSTIVTVLNRFNEEVDGESSSTVFSRILNN